MLVVLALVLEGRQNMYGEVLSDADGRRHPSLNRMKASFIVRLANLAWNGFQAINVPLPEGELPKPQWAPDRIRITICRKVRVSAEV
jgi:hypothetical protein